MDNRKLLAVLAIAALGIYALKNKKPRQKIELVSNLGYTPPTRTSPQPPTTRPPVDLSQKVLPFHWFFDMPRSNVSENDKPLDLISGE